MICFKNIFCCSAGAVGMLLILALVGCLFACLNGWLVMIMGRGINIVCCRGFEAFQGQTYFWESGVFMMVWRSFQLQLYV